MTWLTRHRLLKQPASASPTPEQIEVRLRAYFLKEAPLVEDVEDMVQETMIALHRAIDKGRLDPTQPLDHYAFGIAFKVRANYYRRLYRLPPLLSELDLQREIADPRSRKEMANTRNALYVARLLAIIKEKLSGMEERVLALHYQGESLEEIAQFLGLPAVTTRSHFKRARERLLAHLVENEPELLGGQAAIDEAWQKALAEVPSPSTEEIAAWKKRKPLDKFRDACLKMAKHLPSPLD